MNSAPPALFSGRYEPCTPPLFRADCVACTSSPAHAEVDLKPVPLRFPGVNLNPKPLRSSGVSLKSASLHCSGWQYPVQHLSMFRGQSEAFTPLFRGQSKLCNLPLFWDPCASCYGVNLNPAPPHLMFDHCSVADMNSAPLGTSGVGLKLASFRF